MTAIHVFTWIYMMKNDWALQVVICFNTPFTRNILCIKGWWRETPTRTWKKEERQDLHLSCQPKVMQMKRQTSKKNDEKLDLKQRCPRQTRIFITNGSQVDDKKKEEKKSSLGEKMETSETESRKVSRNLILGKNWSFNTISYLFYMYPAS